MSLPRLLAQDPYVGCLDFFFVCSDSGKDDVVLLTVIHPCFVLVFNLSYRSSTDQCLWMSFLLGSNLHVLILQRTPSGARTRPRLQLLPQVNFRRPPLESPTPSCMVLSVRLPRRCARLVLSRVIVLLATLPIALKPSLPCWPLQVSEPSGAPPRLILEQSYVHFFKFFYTAVDHRSHAMDPSPRPPVALALLLGVILHSLCCVQPSKSDTHPSLRLHCCRQDPCHASADQLELFKKGIRSAHFLFFFPPGIIIGRS